MFPLKGGKTLNFNLPNLLNYYYYLCPININKSKPTLFLCFLQYPSSVALIMKQAGAIALL